MPALLLGLTLPEYRMRNLLLPAGAADARRIAREFSLPGSTEAGCFPLGVSMLTSSIAMSRAFSQISGDGFSSLISMFTLPWNVGESGRSVRSAEYLTGRIPSGSRNFGGSMGAPQVELANQGKAVRITNWRLG